MKKIFTLIFACVATMTVMAQSDGSTVSNSWGLKGSGTQGDPYIISTAADFEAMAKNCNADHKGTGEYFKMTNDIDFGGSADKPVQLPAIGKDGNAQIAKIAYGFDGTFDGYNHTISGIYHTESDNNAAGKYNALFGCIDKNGVVKNIVFGENNHITSYNYVGTIASLNMGTIQECVNNADITATGFAAGGICGYMVNGYGTIRNCDNYGNVKAMTYAAGICGGSQSGKSITTYNYLIENCLNSGKLSTTNGVGSAGIAGSYSGAVKYCNNNGNVDDTQGTAKSKQYTAGIVSCASYAVDIESCGNRGAISGVKNVGGIIGNVMKGDEAATVIKSCVNGGSVSGQDLYVAGIAANSARAEGLVSVESCTNAGEVTSTGTTEFIGNLRGNTTIALGEGNIIGKGLKALPLDPATQTGISNTNVNTGNKANGVFLRNGQIVIVKNNKKYTVSGIEIAE